jgi:hypothetical protein
MLAAHHARNLSMKNCLAWLSAALCFVHGRRPHFTRSGNSGAWITFRAYQATAAWT